LKSASFISAFNNTNGNAIYIIPKIKTAGFKGFFMLRKISAVVKSKVIIKIIKSKYFQSEYRIIIVAAEIIIPEYFIRDRFFFSNIRQNSHRANDDTIREKIRKYIPPKYTAASINGIPTAPARILLVRLLISDLR
jgi:hypothetical protein